MTLELSPFNILVLVAFGLLVFVSGGIIYLTIAEWRDRRRRDQDAREDRGSRRKPSKAR
jgi:hypothetical protein